MFVRFLHCHCPLLTRFHTSLLGRKSEGRDHTQWEGASASFPGQQSMDVSYLELCCLEHLSTHIEVVSAYIIMVSRVAFYFSIWVISQYLLYFFFFFF